MSIETRYKCVFRWLALGALGLATIGATYGQRPVSGEQDSNNGKARAAAPGNDVMLVSLAAPASASATNAMPAPPPSSSFSWTGFYVGGRAAFGLSRGDTSFTPLPSAVLFVNLAPQTLRPNAQGALVGGQAGFNWQAGRRFVLGVEADDSWSGMDGTITISPIKQNNGTPFPGAGFVRAKQTTTWLGTVRGRLGIAPVNRLLIYGTGGLAYGHVIYLADTNFRPVGTTDYLSSFDKNKTGSVAGAGVEVATSRRWSVKAEYLHVDMGTESTVVNASPLLPPFQVGYRFETTAHIVGAGVNFRF